MSTRNETVSLTKSILIFSNIDGGNDKPVTYRLNLSLEDTFTRELS